MPVIEQSHALDISHLNHLRDDMNELSEFVSEFIMKGLVRDLAFQEKLIKHIVLVRLYILNQLLSNIPVEMSRKGLTSLDQTLMSEKSQTAFPLEQYEVRVEYDQVYVKKSNLDDESEPLIVEDSGNFIYNDYHIVVKLPSSEFPLTIRTRIDGDRGVSLKHGGSKKE